MEKDILGEIVTAEREIHERIEHEKENTASWLARKTREAEDEAAEAEAALRASLAQAIDDAKAKAVRNAEEIVKRAGDEAAALLALDETTLHDLIARHLPIIMPEGLRDRQNGKT